MALTLIPKDTSVAARDLIDPSQPVARMIASALRFRPETAGLRAEVAAAATRLKARKVSPSFANSRSPFSQHRLFAAIGHPPHR